MKFLNLIKFKNIPAFFIVIVVLISTIGINITEHTCSSCGIEDKSVGIFTSHDHNNSSHVEIIEMDNSMESSCCSHDIHQDEDNCYSGKCCDFNNVFFKNINLFSPSNNYEIVDVQILDINLHFKNILSNLFYSGFNRTIVKCIKIPDSIPILSKVCKLIL